MVTQTMISVKLDTDTLKKLDDLCVSFGVKRNKMINFAIVYMVGCMKFYSKFNIIRAMSDALEVLKD